MVSIPAAFRLEQTVIAQQAAEATTSPASVTNISRGAQKS